jgi:hypothetical protein
MGWVVQKTRESAKLNNGRFARGSATDSVQQKAQHLLGFERV